MVVNLEASRCPNAQLMLNKVLLKFIDSSELSIEIASIEPSLERSMKHRIAHLELPIDVSDIVVNPISVEQRDKWLDLFDEEDFEDVSVVKVFKITKRD